jgi:cytochrome c-type biogenesis protein
VNPTELAESGPLLLASVVALAAGAVSFASPCVVPLVPGYLPIWPAWSAPNPPR